MRDKARPVSRRELLIGGVSLALASSAGDVFGQSAKASFAAIHRDDHGLIVQADGDGGDTAQREGFVWFGLFIRRTKLKLADPGYLGLTLTLADTMRLLEVGSSGLFRRHPTQHNDPGDFSRDQQTPIVAAMGAWGLTAPLERLWAATEARGRVCQNGDAVGTDQYNLFQRARGPQHEVDPLGELQLRGMLASFFTRDPGDVSDDLNHVVSLAMATLVNRTETARLAMQEYLRDRPHTCGSYLTKYYRRYGTKVTDLKLQQQRIVDWMEEGEKVDAGCTRVFGALRWYFRPESGGNPAIADLYRPIVDDYLVAEGNRK